jgi:glycosyltransferase involved in cell wall biosynthesis
MHAPDHENEKKAFMKFLIITHVLHGKDSKGYFAYGPYVKEMNLWESSVDEVTVVAPLQLTTCEVISNYYSSKKIEFKALPAFSMVGLKATLKTIIQLPLLFVTIFKAMAAVDHIHLRCPGNMGLLGCLVQILFPSKPKTAKYAGNWDPKATQPWTYRLQKKILNNTFLTRNMTVLVYGNWQGMTSNCQSFFTATYSDHERQPLLPRTFETIRILFVGTLSAGKQPLYAIKLVQQLQSNGCSVQLDVFGEGMERKELEAYISAHNLHDFVQLKGNQSREDLKKAYQMSHFVLLPSLSEGWPKAVAEAMYWGCVRAALPVSCVLEMFGHGKRGVVLTHNLTKDAQQLEQLMQTPETFHQMAQEALIWSQQYTLERMEQEIKHLLHG